MDELEAMVEGLGIDEPPRSEQIQTLLRAKVAIEQELLGRHEITGARSPEGEELHSRLDIVKDSIRRMGDG